MASTELSNISSHKTTDLNWFVSMTPGLTYTASIRCCTAGGICSDFENITNTAFGPHKSAVPIVIYSKNGEKMKILDILGEELKDIEGYCKFRGGG